MGIGRAGKTTLSKTIKDKCNSYNLIHSDALKWAMIRAENKENYYRKNVDIQESWTDKLPIEYLTKHAEDWYNSNEMLKK